MPKVCPRCRSRRIHLSFGGIGKAVGHGGLYKCSNCGYQGGAIIEVSEDALKGLRRAERRRIKFRERQQRKRKPPRY